MSANLDLVRSIFAAWERGDFSRADWADPNIEFTIADGPDPTTSTGLSEMAQTFRSSLGAWTDFRVEGDDYREVGEDGVLVLLHAVGGRGKASGHELTTFAQLGADFFCIKNGPVTRLVVYFERHRALADLGLEG